MRTSHSSDLLEYFKLEADVHPECVVHTSYEWQQSQGRQKERIERKWSVQQRLGSGSFGEVRLEVDSDENKRAVKLLEKSRMKNFGIDYKRELTAMAKFANVRNQPAEVLVRFLGWFEDVNIVYLAMEYFPYGDLEKNAENIDETGVKEVTLDLLEGLRIIHAEGFVHRDLKPQNIFVAGRPSREPRWWVKIGDFGVSKRKGQDTTAFRTRAGTQPFQAPEIRLDHGGEESIEYTNAVDMWSLGCTIYMLIAGQMPFPDERRFREFCEGKLSFPEAEIYRKMSDAGVQFLKELIVPEPSKRLTAENALSASWLQTSNQQQNNLPGSKYGDSRQMHTPNDLFSVNTAGLGSSAMGSFDFVRLQKEIGGAQYGDVPSQGIADEHSAQTMLFQAATTGSKHSVETLLRKHIDPDFKDKDGRTPLSFAAARGHIEIVEILLAQEGVNPDVADRYMRTPLCWAAANGHYPVVEKLLERAVEINAKDNYGRTPLSHAAANGYLNIVKLLLNREDVDVGGGNTSTPDAKTPLSRAMANRHEEIANLLLAKGAR